MEHATPFKRIWYDFIQHACCNYIYWDTIRVPVLSAQLITAPTGKPKEILNFPPADPPRPIEN